MEIVEKTELNVFAALNCLNILPSIRGKRIVACGFERHGLSEAAVRLYGASVVNINPSLAGHDKQVCSISGSECDLFVLNADGLIAERISVNNFRKFLQHAYNSLNSRGTILLILPPGIRFFHKKIIYRTLLVLSRYKNIRSYAYVPTSGDQANIFPITHDRKQTFGLLNDHIFGNKAEKGSSRSNGKDFIKYACIKLSKKVNPFTGLMVVASKAKTVDAATYTEELFRANVREVDSHDKLYTVWMARAIKHIGLIYRTGDEKGLLAVCKRSLASINRSFCLREEHEKLLILSRHHAEFAKNKIDIPTPVCFENSGGGIIAIETAVKGAALETFKWRLSSEKFFSPFKDRLDELVSVQITLQETISHNSSENFPPLSKKYFLNSLNISYPGFDDNRRRDAYSMYVQHGDFTDVNIFYDAESKVWGVIDWEWSASGFPFLFDLFYLFTSLEFRCAKDKGEDVFDHYYKSFVETYFTENFFSDYIKLAVLNYCQKFDLEVEAVFGYFLDFLLFQYNKFKFDFDQSGHVYLILYEKFMEYSIRNRDAFIIVK